MLKRRNVVLRNGASITPENLFEGNNTIDRGVRLIGCSIGFLSYVGYESILYKTRVGRYCSIGPRVAVAFGNHPTSLYVSTHPVFFSNREYCGVNYCKGVAFKEIPYVDQEKKYVVDIGNDVWIGQGAIIINGIKIGDGAIIGAGSIVTKDIPPYAIAVGCPAKVIHFRFEEIQIEKLLKIKWWEWNEEIVNKKSKSFTSIDVFLSDNS